MSFDYSDLGFSNRLQKLNAPVTRDQPLSGFDFDSLYEVQTNRLKASSVQFDNLIRISSLTTAAGTIGNNEGVALTTTLSPGGSNQNSVSRRLLANPYVSVYQGTSLDADFQIYPVKGGSIGYDDYKLMSGYAEHRDETVNEVFNVNIINTSGTAQDLYFQVSWKYIQNNDGVVE